MSLSNEINSSTVIHYIESLDWGYEMSDDHELYKTQHSLKLKLEDYLSAAPIDEVQSIISNLSPYGFSNWERYFKLI